jgi:hypothetical protein
MLHHAGFLVVCFLEKEGVILHLFGRAFLSFWFFGSDSASAANPRDNQRAQTDADGREIYSLNAHAARSYRSPAAARLLFCGAVRKSQAIA